MTCAVLPSCETLGGPRVRIGIADPGAACHGLTDARDLTLRLPFPVGAVVWLTGSLSCDLVFIICGRHIVRAMGEEIRQSQLLDDALERGGKMSEAVARQRFEEARPRYENAQAAIAEQNAIKFGSIEYQRLRKI